MGHDRPNAENLRLRNFRRENPPQALKKGLPQMAELVYRPVIGAARTMFKALDLKIDTQGSEHIPKTGGAVLKRSVVARRSACGLGPSSAGRAAETAVQR